MLKYSGEFNKTVTSNICSNGIDCLQNVHETVQSCRKSSGSNFTERNGKECSVSKEGFVLKIVYDYKPSYLQVNKLSCWLSII